jgi:hypothetical protein
MGTRRGNLKAFLLVFVVFILGVALGASGLYLVNARVLAARPQAVRTAATTTAMFTKDLNLNQDQQAQILAILSQMRDQYAAIHAKADPEYDQARQQGRERIRQLLTADQKPEFEDLLRRMDEERLKRQNAAR